MSDDFIIKRAARIKEIRETKDLTVKQYYKIQELFYNQMFPDASDPYWEDIGSDTYSYELDELETAREDTINLEDEFKQKFRIVKVTEEPIE